MTLEALREKIGNDATFFRIMYAQAQENRFGTVTTPGFIAIAERESGLELDALLPDLAVHPRETDELVNPISVIGVSRRLVPEPLTRTVA